MLTNHNSNLLSYFNNLAAARKKIRSKHAYYWNEITEYCSYFSHETYSVLEVGCGTGELLAQIKGNRKVGIDLSPEMLKIAHQQFPQIEFIESAAEDLNLNEKFDLILLSNLVGYVDDVQIILEKLHTVCHERTKIIVTYYNHLWEPLLKLGESIGIKTKTPNQNWLTRHDIKNFLELAGFSVYRERRRMIFPFYVPLISTFLNRYIANLPLIKYLSINSYAFAKPQPKTLTSEEKNKYSVSIVIPARNESGNIENAITRLPKFGKWQEIIFIEGNSTDDTWDKIQEIQNKYKDTHKIKVGKQNGKGKNDAVRKGFSIATGDILMILDADLTVPPEDLPKFYEAIESGKGDFINGSRLVYQMEKQAMQFLNILGNKFFSWSFSWLLDQPFKDTLCGTKVIFREDYDRLVTNRKFFGDFDPFGDYDLIFGAYKLNLKIIELPIRYKERTYGSTNISRFKHGLILLRMCFFAARKIKFI